MKTITKLWIGIILLIILSPLGLILPERFRAGAAWGEWEISNRLANLWQSPIPDYAFKGWADKGMPALSFAYIISAVVGIPAVVAVVYLWAKFLIKPR